MGLDGEAHRASYLYSLESCGVNHERITGHMTTHWKGIHFPSTARAGGRFFSGTRRGRGAAIFLPARGGALLSSTGRTLSPLSTQRIILAWHPQRHYDSRASARKQHTSNTVNTQRSSRAHPPLTHKPALQRQQRMPMYRWLLTPRAQLTDSCHTLPPALERSVPPRPRLSYNSSFTHLPPTTPTTRIRANYRPRTPARTDTVHQAFSPAHPVPRRTSRIKHQPLQYTRRQLGAPPSPQKQERKRKQ